MSEWRDVLLDQVIDFGIGGTPSRNAPSFWSEKPLGHPWLSIADLKEKFISQTAEHISDIGASCSNVKLIPANTTVMSFKLSIGRTAITLRPMFCNEAIAFFEPKYNQADSRWLYHELPRASKHVATDIAVKGATLNKEKIRLIPFRLPPLEEQKKIANILDTLDTQIHQTEALITKLEQIKQGLLTDLLTRGIAANGQLRPTPTQAPQLYKDSPLGQVPKEWEIGPIAEFGLDLVDGDRGSNYPSENELTTEDGYCLFLSAKNVTNTGFQFNSRQFITKEKDLSLGTGGLVPGDIVVTTRGTVGNFAHFNESVPYLRMRINSGMLIIRNRGHNLASDFIYIAMKERFFNIELLRKGSGSAQPQLPAKDFKTFCIAAPSLEEQNQITYAFNQYNERILNEHKLLKKLRLQKSGQMDDLLTGRVRVTPLLEKEPA